MRENECNIGWEEREVIPPGAKCPTENNVFLLMLSEYDQLKTYHNLK